MTLATPPNNRADYFRTISGNTIHRIYANRPMSEHYLSIPDDDFITQSSVDIQASGMNKFDP